jgi:hypothetical protein
MVFFLGQTRNATRKSTVKIKWQLASVCSKYGCGLRASSAESVLFSRPSNLQISMRTLFSDSVRSTVNIGRVAKGSVIVDKTISKDIKLPQSKNKHQNTCNLGNI